MKLRVAGRDAYFYSGGKPFDAGLPAVVLLHGALHDHSVWALQSRWLAHHGHAVLAPDLPGHGRSPGPALPDVQSLGAWVLALLDAAGVERAALVGHSMGSLVALEAAASLGTRATALVMLATAYPMKVSADLLQAALDDPLAAIDRVNAFSHSGLAAKPSMPGPGSWLHGGNRALMRRMQALHAQDGHGNLFHLDFTACDRYDGLGAAAERLRCPSTLLLGDKDRMTPPRQAQALIDLLRPARVVRLPFGHALMAEAPQAVLGCLRDALAAAADAPAQPGAHAPEAATPPQSPAHAATAAGSQQPAAPPAAAAPRPSP